VTEILEKEDNSIATQTEYYPLASRSWRDPQLVSQYFKKEKHTFALYCVHHPVPRLPRLRIGRSCRIDFRRRSSAAASTRYPSTTSLSYVPFETVKTFIELLELPQGWNSYNAKQIRKENVNAAIGLLGRIMRPGTPPPIVVPKVRGGVQLEWHTRGVNIEVSIDSPEEVSFFAEELLGSQEFVDQQLDEDALGEWIDRISN
jgi:hypothetical protein